LFCRFSSRTRAALASISAAVGRAVERGAVKPHCFPPGFAMIKEKPAATSNAGKARSKTLMMEGVCFWSLEAKSRPVSRS